jgi:hypothetical protein
MPKRNPSDDPRINVQVPHNLRAKARNKAKGEGKNLGQLIVMLLKAYVAPVKKAA